MKKIKDEVDLKSLEKYFTVTDSCCMSLYSSLTITPIRFLNVWLCDRRIVFVNGEFPAGKRLLKKLESMGYVEETNDSELLKEEE